MDKITEEDRKRVFEEIKDVISKAKHKDVLNAGEKMIDTVKVRIEENIKDNQDALRKIKGSYFENDNRATISSTLDTYNRISHDDVDYSNYAEGNVNDPNDKLGREDVTRHSKPDIDDISH